MQGAQNSCNPVFIEVGLRLGVASFCDYFRKFGLMDKTGIDLPGEASTIMHKEENIGQVELATMSFGQSFQITPIQLATTVSSLINGGTRVTPHFGVEVLDGDGNVVETLKYDSRGGILSEETSQTVREILESVVSEGSGKNAYIEGYEIGGKTATSQTLPKKRKPVYLILPGICAGGRSGRTGNLYYQQSPGSLLRRNDLRAGDAGHFFQRAAVSGNRKGNHKKVA